MDNLPHSVSKKAYNANGVRAKTVYDDVFGGPPKFGVPTLCPRVSDYSEIFGSFHASRASSIPILDLPAVDEAEFSVDVRSSMFDYSEVFGGLNGVDFAASFEELFDQSKTTFDSSDEAWTPAQSESLSDESDPSSERNQNLSNGESHQSCDGIKQINMSYDKASQRSKEDMSSGMSHITQLHAVSGLTSIVNEVPSSQKIEDRNTPLQATDDLNTKMDFSGGLRAEKQFRKTMSHPSNRSFGIQTLGTDLKPVGYGKTASHKNETFVTVSDISLRTQPSQLPPPLKPPHGLAVNGGESARRKSKLKASKSFAFGDKTGYSSPPFFDVEVDPSSSAAASAAAMKDVMEKAQAKLKSAKELMERKKEGLQSRTKLGLKNDTKDKEGKASKAFDGSNIFKDERVHETCQSDCSGMKAFAGEERKKVMKTTQVASDSIEGGNHINVAKISADKKNGKEDRSSQEFYKTEGTVAWREAAQFYEVVEIDKSRKIFEQAKDERHEKKAIPVFQQQEDNRKTKADRETCEREGNEGRSKATKESNMQEEHGKKVKVNQEVCIQEETGKKPRMVQQHGDIDKILTEAASEECDNLIGVHQKENQMEVEEKLKEANERIVDDKRNKDAHEKEENERRLEETLEMEKYEKRLEEAFERAEIEKGLKEALEREEKEQQQREAFEKEEKEKRQKETCEREENEKRLEKAREIEEKKRLKEALELEENEKILALMLEGNEKRLKMALECQRNEKWKEVAREREENEKRLREDLRREEIDKKLKVALEQEVNAKKQKEAHEREENEERLNEDCEREGNEKRLKEVRELDEKKKRLQEAHEREEREKRSEEAFKQKEIEKRSEDANECEETQKRIEDAGYWEELKGWSKDHEQNERDENERKLKSNQGTCVHAEGGNLKTSDVACKLDDHENLQPGQAACKQDKNSGNVEIIEGNPLFEEDRTMRTEPIDSEDTRLEAVEVVNVLFEEEINSSGVTLDYPQPEKNQIKMKDVKSHHLHDTVTESVEAGIGQTHVHRNKKALKIASNSGTPNGLIHELGERRTDVKEVQVTFYKEDSKDKFMSIQVAGELIENGRKMGADKPTVLEGKRNAQSTAQKLSTSKSAERKEKNLNDILIPEEREKEERIKRERELEKDRLRKIEEEREREREREKDRMAVDRATLEACERTLGEARDRAERAAVEKATAEVRQRAMAEARERLEKASAEARERSLGEKASMEARLRAERAAVERATAEARERAFQKAMVEKATFEERRYIERSVSDKSFASYKNDGMRQSSSFSDLQDGQFQGMRSSSGSIYSYSSVHGASYDNERFVGVEGESAQRCKARLERHQRTAERAAKALAEKNMRDLIAQKEQVERNRFAEALDAEVKRWSSGKEGNLRALLSTLQYILGPNSSWRPIPLTEVITATAVKKAYRKATLCVHPDKLQQRGASIQQKYICEKVFDLLKEAWNRFNSEER